MEFELLVWNVTGPLARLWHNLSTESTDYRSREYATGIYCDFAFFSLLPTTQRFRRAVTTRATSDISFYG